MEDIKITQIRCANNHDGTWALEVDILRPDETHTYSDDIKQTIYINRAEMSTAPRAEIITIDYI